MAHAEPKPDRRPSPAARREHLRGLVLSLALGLLGALPTLPNPWGPSVPGGGDEFAFLAWIACLAPTAGAVAGGVGLDPLRFAPVAPASWAVALALSSAARPEPPLAFPALAAAGWTGLFYLGYAVGAWTRAAASTAAVLALLSALLVALPTRAGLPGAPWPAETARRALDVSPFVLIAECGGVRDLAWHRSLYAPAGTDRFAREPWPASGTAFLLLGAGVLAALLARRARAASGGSPPRPEGHIASPTR